MWEWGQENPSPVPWSTPEGLRSRAVPLDEAKRRQDTCLFHPTGASLPTLFTMTLTTLEFTVVLFLSNYMFFILLLTFILGVVSSHLPVPTINSFNTRLRG